MNILHCVGARPNFVKVAPVIAALKSYPSITQTLIHTGQHYDDEMSRNFFTELSIPTPNVNLHVTNRTNGTVQVANIMCSVRPVLENYNPDLVMVYGDVNSTLACALVAAQLNLRIAHVEAGLRSFDRTMPEELNRIVTDRVSDLLFVSERSALGNLHDEGRMENFGVHFVGNVMIDTLVKMLPKARAFTGDVDEYILVTLHRPRNVDDTVRLSVIVDQLNKLSEHYKIIFPAHPRTREAMKSMTPKFMLRSPMGYWQFIVALNGAKVVITDSGGVQDEAAYLGRPCLTVRPVTERPITLSYGNALVTPNGIAQFATSLALEYVSDGQKPEKWDGKAAERIVEVIVNE